MSKKNLYQQPAANEEAQYSSSVVRSQINISQLYTDFHQKLLSHVVKKGLTYAEAEEVVQEAFVRLLKLDNKDVTSYIQAYLYRIATNLTIDRLRRHAISPEVQANADVSEDYMDFSSSPETKVKYRKLLEKMSDVIETLPEKCQLAFLLYKVKGMEYKEIAAHMNLTESMVRKHVLRVVRHCYDRMKDDL
ncbi:RNA polymerase sigma factor [Teredinibacter sp. KSP-S5-2]|uniref:RNA polymerase sigma factor n=1 Tax=Teredinibacter sp. KSP-S5-2 TaxID=3034506 RepID=UPI002934D90F|nr:RNA polymerase sigma factor [Teredinibacter sp. KSP-S5-2]WNO08675.1 RNA polymerase sigma factor [Teredinibacter sp. KSP-S5-2]